MENLGYMIVRDGDFYCGTGPDRKPIFLTTINWLLNDRFVTYLFDQDSGTNQIIELEKLGLKGLKLALVQIDLANALEV